MSNTCPKTPYSSKTNPYTEKASPFASILSPYNDKYFCPVDFLLQENGEFLLQQDGDKIIL